MKVLILGVSGMLGYSIFSRFSEEKGLFVHGTARSIKGKEHFFKKLKNLVLDVDVKNIGKLESVVNELKPDVVVNCIGLIKQQCASQQYIEAIEINSLLPHKLAKVCDQVGARLIHFSTDCVFDGKKGNYSEEDLSNAQDLYGKSKHLGEVGYGNHLTLRTSIIGHELNSSLSLIDWFLSQENTIKGFTKARFSGMPTAYVAEVLLAYVIPNAELIGLNHLSVDPIDKFTLLKKVAKVYRKNIQIEKYDDVEIDRTLDSSKFKAITKMETATWDELVELMYVDYQKRYRFE